MQYPFNSHLITHARSKIFKIDPLNSKVNDSVQPQGKNPFCFHTLPACCHGTFVMMKGQYWDTLRSKISWAQNYLKGSAYWKKTLKNRSLFFKILEINASTAYFTLESIDMTLRMAKFQFLPQFYGPIQKHPLASPLFRIPVTFCKTLQKMVYKLESQFLWHVDSFSSHTAGNILIAP